MADSKEAARQILFDVPSLPGAEFAQANTTAFFRAADWPSLFEIAKQHEQAPAFYRYFDQDTGHLGHVAWKRDGLTICVWGPS